MHQPEYKSLTKEEKTRLSKFCRVERMLLTSPGESQELKDQWEEDLEDSFDDQDEDSAFVKFQLERSVAHGLTTAAEAAAEMIKL